MPNSSITGDVVASNAPATATATVDLLLFSNKIPTTTVDVVAAHVLLLVDVVAVLVEVAAVDK